MCYNGVSVRLIRQPVSEVLMSAPLIGFCGSRSLAPRWRACVAGAVAGVVAAGAGVAVGCAAGADALVRSAAPGAAVFSVAPGRFGSGRAAFARRSVACVRAVASSGQGAAFAGFVSASCPAGLVPSSGWRAGAVVSGSWSALALAAGLGLPVFVFRCAFGVVLPSSWGAWSRVAAGPFAGAWRLSPAVQGALF